MTRRAGLNLAAQAERSEAAAHELGLVRQLEVIRQTQVMEVALERIDASGTWNPRGQLGGDPYAEVRLQGLMAAIEEVGQLSPALVRPHPDHPGHFQLVMGWRRYHSRLLLGHAVLLVQVGEFRDDQLALIATMENTQREDLEQFEAVRGIFRVLAARLGVDVTSVPTLMNRVLNSGDDPHRLRQELAMLSSQSLSTFSTKYARVLKLSSAEQQAVYDRRLSATVALELVKLGDRPERSAFLKQATQEGWSTREAAARVRALSTAALSPSSTELGQLARSVSRRLSPQALDSLSVKQAQRVERLLKQLDDTLNSAIDARQ